MTTALKPRVENISAFEPTENGNFKPPRSVRTVMSSRAVSPPIENVVHSFNVELDNLTKSFDDLLSQHENVKPTEATPYHKPRFSYSTAKKVPIQVKDPPPSAERFSPLRNYRNSTPARRKENKVYSYTPAEPPPAPVQTPATLPNNSATPNRKRSEYDSVRREYDSVRRDYDSGRRDYDSVRRDHDSVRRDQKERHESYPSTSKKSEYNISPTVSSSGSASRQKLESANGIDPQSLNFTLAPRDWEEALEKMRQTLGEQENAIKDLLQENAMLRQQLRESSDAPKIAEEATFVRDSPSSHQKSSRQPPRQRGDPSPYREYGQNTREDFSAYRDDNLNMSIPANTSDESFHLSVHHEPNGRRPMSSPTATYRTTPMSTPVRSIRSPPKRIHTATAAQMIPEEFTPGTLFVAELSKYMKMEEGHHAPLSVILDKHWDQLKLHFDA